MSVCNRWTSKLPALAQWLHTALGLRLHAGEAPAPEFMRALAERLPQHEDELMTIAQQLEQKGIEKGRAEGIQLGRQEGHLEGKLEGKLEVARSLLKMGMSRESVQEATGLSEDDLAQIRH